MFSKCISPKLAIGLFLAVLFSQIASATATVSVSIKSSATKIDPTDTATLTATVTNDVKSAGVTWTLAGVGALSKSTITTTVYTAAAAKSAAQTVTVKATSKADTTKSAMITLTIPALLTVSTTSLAAGKVGTAYSVTLAATGGISPYTWTLTSGTLPSGLSLAKATGVISGTPKAAGVGTATLVFKATDAGTATAATATKSLTLKVTAATAISFTTTSLAAGTTAAPYSATVTATGGAGTLSYTLASGTLPTGTTLTSTTGVLAGSPSAAGTFTFSIKAADAYGDSATKSYTVKITKVTVAITPTSLSTGVVGTAYKQTFAASGGTGTSYTWAVSSGSSSLTTLGLTLSTAGVLSGTPKATGSVSITVKATDTNKNSGSKSYTLKVTAAASSGHASYLKGNYAFILKGWLDGVDVGTTYKHGVVGSFVADGSGNITSGVMDVNMVSGLTNTATLLTDLSFTGTYTLAADNLGKMTLNFTASGVANKVVLAFTTGAISSGVASSGAMIEYQDATGIGSTKGAIRASGEFAMQTKSSFTTANLKGGYAFGMDGETCPIYVYSGTVSSACKTATDKGPLSVAGVMTLSGAGAVSSGMEDVAVGTTGYKKISLTGSYGTPNATSGRVVLTLNPGSTGLTSSDQTIWPKDFAFYMVDATKLFVMSIDSHKDHALMTGIAQQQTVTSFTNANLSGTAIMFGVIPGGDTTKKWGTSSATSQAYADVGRIVATPTSGSTTAGTVAVSIWENSAGSVNTTANTASGIAYTIATNGRATFSEGTDTMAIYLFATNKGFLTKINDHAGLDFLEPQKATMITSGSYAAADMGFVPRTSMSVFEFSGTVASSALTGTMVYAQSDNGVLDWDQSQSGTFPTFDSTGFSTSDYTGPCYVVTSTKFVCITGSDYGGTSPTATVYKQ